MIEPSTIVSDSELAALLGMSARRIRQLAEAGTLERVGVNQYELGPCFQALLEEASGSGSALVRERTRKLKADADRAELQLAKDRSEIAPIDEFERVQSAMYAVIQRNVLNVAQRAVLRLLGETNESTWKQVMRDELTSALRTAAETKLDQEETEENEPIDH